MTNDERLAELRRQHSLLRSPQFRISVQGRRDILSAIVPLLNFNDTYYANAVPIADVLGRPGFSSNFYDQAFAQIDSIVSQAIAELQHGITVTKELQALVPTAKLTDEHGLVWFWHHCSWRVRWWLIAKAVIAAAVLIGIGFGLGRINFFVQVWQLWQKAGRP